MLDWYADAPPGRKLFVSSGMSFIAMQSGVENDCRQPWKGACGTMRGVLPGYPLKPVKPMRPCREDEGGDAELGAEEPFEVGALTVSKAVVARANRVV
jgi:hypothetical protein